MQAYQVVNDSPAWAVLALVRAMFEYENNQLATAESLLNTAIPRLAMSAISDFRVNAFITLARVHASRDNFAAAESVLSELSDLISEGNDKRWMNYIVHEQIRVALLAGKPDFQARWQKKFPYMQRESSGATRTKYCPAVGHVPERTQLMLALQQRNLEVAERALGQLGKISSLHSDSFLRVVVLSGSAALEFCQENHDQAIVFLNEALALCKQANLYRTLFDENFLFAEVFQLARSLGRVDDDINSEWLQRLKEERFPRPRILKPSNATPAEPAVDSLTDTEIKVLDLLAQGLSNKDISRRMGIAVTTTKWHLKNIFSKLAASNRVGALIRARELHLLSVAGDALQLLPSTIAVLAAF
jgi:LuxR family maltose regulon positive regulatory protein